MNIVFDPSRPFYQFRDSTKSEFLAHLVGICSEEELRSVSALPLEEAIELHTSFDGVPVRAIFRFDDPGDVCSDLTWAVNKTHAEWLANLAYAEFGLAHDMFDDEELGRLPMWMRRDLFAGMFQDDENKADVLLGITFRPEYAPGSEAAEYVDNQQAEDQSV